MRRLVLIGIAVAGVAAVARRVVLGCSAIDFEKLIGRMPENAPPRWMFRNITAIRQNTERIVDLLESERADGDRPRAAAGVD